MDQEDARIKRMVEEHIANIPPERLAELRKAVRTPGLQITCGGKTIMHNPSAAQEPEAEQGDSQSFMHYRSDSDSPLQMIFHNDIQPTLEEAAQVMAEELAYLRGYEVSTEALLAALYWQETPDNTLILRTTLGPRGYFMLFGMSMAIQPGMDEQTLIETWRRRLSHMGIPHSYVSPYVAPVREFPNWIGPPIMH